jgi:hypothetical protein
LIIYTKKRFKVPVPIIIATFTVFILEFATKNKTKQKRKNEFDEALQEFLSKLKHE